MEFHYEKHHRGYVTKLNTLVQNSALQDKTLTELVASDPKTLPGGVYNCAAQTWNHTFYWNSLTAPKNSVGPSEPVLKAINESFGSYDDFVKKFTDVSVNHFASGWSWLVLDKATGKLRIVDTHDAGSVLTDANLKPLLTCDVWEHAYYIDHRNARPKYLESYWKLVNWKFVENNLLKESGKL